jgi:hypothetical protein
MSVMSVTMGPAQPGHWLAEHDVACMTNQGENNIDAQENGNTIPTFVNLGRGETNQKVAILISRARGLGNRLRLKL